MGYRRKWFDMVGEALENVWHLLPFSLRTQESSQSNPYEDPTSNPRRHCD
jgi:hypothetical protein